MSVVLIRARMGLPTPGTTKGLTWPCMDDSIFFKALGVMSVAIGAAEAGLAWEWEFYWGFVAGLLCVVLGISLVAPATIARAKRRITAYSLQDDAHEHRSDPPSDEEPGGSAGRAGAEQEGWGAALKERYRSWLRGRAAAYGSRALIVGFWLYVLVLLLIRAGSKDPSVKAFPERCAESMLDGCTRVAFTEPNRDGGVEPLALDTSLISLQQSVVQWVSSRPRSRILAIREVPEGVLIHARFVSPYWGFADDQLMLLSCDAEGGASRLEAQAYLRIGGKDMGVNRRRVVSLFEWMGGAPLPKGGGCGKGVRGAGAG